MHPHKRCFAKENVLAIVNASKANTFVLFTAVLLQTVHVNCWRPVGRSCVSELRRFFVGGTPELEDPTYVAVPSTFDVSTTPVFFVFGRTDESGTAPWSPVRVYVSWKKPSPWLDLPCRAIPLGWSHVLSQLPSTPPLCLSPLDMT